MGIQETISLTNQRSILVKRIKHIPNSILNDNISLVEYGTQNFQCISQIAQIQDRKIIDQYFIGKSKKNRDLQSAFTGLEIMTGIKLEEFDDFPLEKSSSQEGLLVIQDVPPKTKMIMESENSLEYQSKNAFDHCVDACLDAVPTDFQSFIISTVEKKRFINIISSTSKFNWRRFISIASVVLWFSLLVGLAFFLKWKFDDIPFKDNELPELITIPFITKLRMFFEDPSVRLWLGFWAFTLILGLIYFALKIRGKIGLSNRNSFSFKSKGSKIAELKEQSAHVNHNEEKAQWGTVNQSFVILIQGDDLAVLRSTLQSLKFAIEGIYSGCIFSVNGTILLPEESDFKTQINSILGWNLNVFWRAIKRVIPFKPTEMSIPRSGKNYFRLIKEKFIPGTEIVEGSSYKIPIERTIGDWYLGKVFRKIGQESYPYYITPDVLNQQGLLIGQTGRGKTFLMYKLLEQINKFNPEIHYCIFDLKGGEYTRFFAKKSIVFIPGSEEAPLGINIFRINETDIESNKRVVMHLLNNFIVQTISDSAELSAFMKDIINQAVDRVFLQSIENRTMRAFVQKIDEVLIELEDDGLGWIEKTRTALKARFRELFTGWFQHLFCVTESNFKAEMLQEKNVIFKLNLLISDNDLPTAKFLVNVIMSLISSYAKELQDLTTDKPWLVCIFEEAQKIVPHIHRKDSSEASIVENFVEIARAHRVSSIAIGQNPSKISERFHQAGFIVDFGTESDVLDKVVFGKDFLRAPEEKEQLTSSQMCFVKIMGEKRVLLKVDDYDYSNALTDSQLNHLFEHDSTYQLIRDQYQLEPVVLDDLEGKKGKKRLAKQKVVTYCQQNCSTGSTGCPSFDGANFTKHKLPRKGKKQLQEMLAKEDGNSFIRFCHHVAKDKKDALCVLLHYLIRIVQQEILDETSAQEMLLRGELYFQSIIEEQEFLQEIEKTESLTEVEYELSVVDKQKEFITYSFNFNDLNLGEGGNE